MLPQGVVGARNVTFLSTFETAIKRAQRLRESEEHFRLLVEGTHDYAIFMLDSEGRVKTWNAGAERLTEYASSVVESRFGTSLFNRRCKANCQPQPYLL